MGFNFPNAPTIGQVFPPTGTPLYQWNGQIWASVGGGNSRVWIQDTAPANPADGDLFWESDTGLLYLRYNDGDSSQWVTAVAVPDAATVGASLSAVTYTSQVLNSGQRIQACQNINAVAKTGDTMTGQLSLVPVTGNAQINLNKKTATDFSLICGLTNNSQRWALSLADGTAESGGNAGSNFSINRYSDANVFVDTPLSINRATGTVAFPVPPTVNGKPIAVVDTDTAWKPFPYVNAWVDYGAPYSPCGYRKLSNGLVILRGLVQSGTATTIFTLPAGYRPGIQLLFGVETSPNALCRIDITTAGVVTHTGASNAWISLNGIMFYAEN